MAPTAELSHLPKADGSASFAYCGYAITAAVNGPVEAQRRDENPFEAVVDVNIRPAAGVGGTAERQLEAILEPALRHLIPVKRFPRCVIQITFQVMGAPENAYVNTKITQAQLNLGIIPGLLHSAVLGLLTAAIPLKKIASAVTLAIVDDDESSTIKADPSPKEIAEARSVHCLVFTSDDELLLVESEGSFTVEEWDKVLQTGQRICCQSQEQTGVDTEMGGYGAETQNIKAFMRSVMETKAAEDLHWK
ncbi:Exosome complex component RRP46-like protein [Cladobotryum mycophilum]|uniref:Exosome complex component RRP46-like protein n=1 Tax=Cladobotryum mycophilum TaxID=491253 RepID=A0ABR0SFZ6_9HYPO